jgi:hypothetical protein
MQVLQVMITSPNIILPLDYQAISLKQELANNLHVTTVNLPITLALPLQKQITNVLVFLSAAAEMDVKTTFANLLYGTQTTK